MRRAADRVLPVEAGLKDRRNFVGVYAFPSYAYVPPSCYWQAGYWVNQPYVDAWGRYSYVQQWVPAQWICP